MDSECIISHTQATIHKLSKSFNLSKLTSVASFNHPQAPGLTLNSGDSTPKKSTMIQRADQ